ncbi:MAG: T9SS type A sorting domain-containing protein [Marinoscillum sp.]
MNQKLKPRLTLVVILWLSSFLTSAQSLNYGYAHDITNGVVADGSPFSISAQNGSPTDIEFSPDGLAMFVLDASNDEIDIYKLTTPFEISSGVSVNGSSFSVSGQETNANGFAFANNGLKMYVTGSSGDDVNVYSLSNAYDLSTGVTVDGSPFSLTGQLSNPKDLVISKDGSRMFVLAQDEIFQYNLSIAYRVVSGVTYNDVSYSVATEDAQGYSLSFNADGTKMLFLGSDGKDINQYSLTAPYDLSGGVSFDGSPFVLTGQEVQPRGFAINTAGTKMFVVGWAGDDVNQYSLSVDEDFEEAVTNNGSITGSLHIDITGDSFTNAGSTLTADVDYSIENLPAGLASTITVAADGLSASLTLSGSATDHQRINNINSLEFNFENSAFTSGDASAVLNATTYSSNFGVDFMINSKRLTFGYAFDITQGITYDGTPYSFAGQETNPYGITFSNDGSKMFIAGIAGDDINQYSLSNPFDVTSGVTFDGSPFSVFSQEATLSDITFNSDGTKMYVIGGGNGDEINQYSLSNPFDITSGVSYDNNPLLIYEESATRDLVFSPDGYTLLVLGPGQINQYSLETPFETRYGVTHDGSPYSFSSEETGAVSMAFSTDGLRMLILGANGKDVNQYSLSTPFDITSGVTFDGSPFSIASESTFPRGIAFSADGTKMYMIGSTGGVHQYSLNIEDDFTETSANTGLVESDNLEAKISISGDTFTNAGDVLSEGSHYSISNLPAGLAPALSVAADGLSATLSLSGSASSHQGLNNLENLVFSFHDGAFTGGDASLVANSTSVSSGFAVTFADNAVITYGFEAFDFDAGPTFDGSPFSLLPQEASPNGIAFNSDGTRMFIIGNSSNKVHQFDLENPYNLTSGVTLDGSTSAFGFNPSGMGFNNDGSKLFILLGSIGSTKAVREYTLSANFDITSSLSYVTSFDVSGEELQPQGLNFNNNGSRMYIVGTNGNEVNQYTLSTPYSLASVEFDGSTSIGGEPLDISFSNDGSLMFILGFSFDNVARYSLNTPFDITSGVVSAGNAFSVESEDASPKALTFSPDGSKMYVVGSNTDEVNQYSIESGGFDETASNTGSVEGSLTIGLSGDTFTNAGGSLSGSDYAINNLPSGLTPTISVAADGLTAQLTLGGIADDHQSADDIASLNFTFQNSAFTSDNAGGVFNAENAESDFGIVFDENARLVYGFDAFDLNAGVTYDGSPYSFSGEEGNPGGIAFSNDGMKMFIVGVANDNVNQYNLTNPYDITTSVSFHGSVSVAAQETNPTGVQFSTDGFKMFVIGATGDDVNQYSLSSAFDVTSTVLFQGNYSISSEENTPQDFTFNTDGTKMYVVGSSGDDVNQYTLSTPFDITGTVTFDGSPFSVATEETVPAAIAFSSNGRKMFILGLSGDDINQYSLKTSFDVRSGVSFETTFSVASEETTPTGLAFSTNGSKFFVVGQIGDDVNQYTINKEKFTEAIADDGSIEGSLTIRIFSDTFTNAGGSLPGSNYSIDNLPAGLTSTLAIAADGLSGALTLGGNASNNLDDDDVASLQFTFENSAFTSTAAADVLNAVGAESNAGIDFNGEIDEAITWDGSSWSNTTGPTASDDVMVNGAFTGAFTCAKLTVSAGNVLTVNGTLDVKGDLTNNGNIIVSSGSSLITYASSSVSGDDIEIRRETCYADGRYSFVGSPVEQNAETTATDLGAHVYTYDESQSTDENDVLRWVATQGTDELVPGTGYTQAKKQLLTFFGTPNTGEITIDGNFTGTYNDGINEAAEGWNLVSNPYAAAINVSGFLTENPNIDGAVYIWDDNGSNNGRGTNSDYIIANGTIATNTTSAGGHSRYNQHIGSAQAFFVKLINHTDTEISFIEDLRVNGSNSDDNFFRTASIPAYTRINLTNTEGLFKQTIVGWLPGISDDEVDRGFDARVFSTNAPDLIYTLKGDEPLAIQGISHEREVVLLGLNVSVDGLYTLSVDSESAQSRPLYLRDKQTGEVLDMTTRPYTFSASAGYITDRFELLSNYNVLGSAIAQTDVYAHESVLYIRSSATESRSFRLVNLSGQVAWTGTVTGNTTIDLSSLPVGVYLVTDGQVSTKIILK